MAFNVQEMSFSYTNFQKISLPWEGESPSLWPPLRNPGCTTVTGIAKRHKGPCSPLIGVKLKEIFKGGIYTPVYVVFIMRIKHCIRIGTISSPKSMHAFWHATIFRVASSNYCVRSNNPGFVLSDNLCSDSLTQPSAFKRRKLFWKASNLREWHKHAAR